MKIIYSGIQAENYNDKRRNSFEYNNFYLTLKRMLGVEVIEYPYDSILTLGVKQFNKNLLALVEAEKPDLFFAFMFTDELDLQTLDQIKKHTVSLAWFADDHWRLDNYSRHYAPHFTWALTTWSKAPAWYASYGIRNIIRSQWACNPEAWYPIDIKKDIDVSFVGQRNSARQKIIKILDKHGVDVWVRGWGWPNGRLTQKEVIENFSRSRINLNFSTPPSRWRARLLARVFLRRSIDRIVLDLPHIFDNIRSWYSMGIPQIKARPFEILACRGFLISGFADDMGQYYKDGKEIVYYDGTIDDLVEKIRYYESHDAEREAIAQAGYERTLKEHTYEQRFRDVFEKIGLTP